VAKFKDKVSYCAMVLLFLTVGGGVVTICLCDGVVL
jgi:hypothetical protein